MSLEEDAEKEREENLNEGKVLLGREYHSDQSKKRKQRTRKNLEEL